MDKILPVVNEVLLKDKHKMQLIIGYNSSGKTTLIKEVYNKYKNNDKYITLYFPENRTMNFSGEEINDDNLMYALEGKPSLLDNIKKIYRITDSIPLKEIKKHDKITCDYLQIINFLFTIYKTEQICKDTKKKIILIIDDIELFLHPLMQFMFLDQISQDTNLKKIYVTARYTDSSIQAIEHHIRFDLLNVCNLDFNN